MKKFYTFLLVLICAITANAQLSVDPTFNPTDNGGGKHNGVFGGDWGVDQTLILPNGQILTSGFYGVMHNKNSQGVSLLNADGSIDPAFKAPGSGDDLGDGITAMALQPNGKILLGGYISVYHARKVSHLVRINSDGSLDNSFKAELGSNDPYSDVPRSIVVLSNGKIMIGGYFGVYNGIAVNGLIRLNANGSLDSSFNFQAEPSASIRKVVAEDNGKLIVGGRFVMQSNSAYKNLVRLNKDGSLDENFNPTKQILVNEILAFDVQADRKIVFGCDSSVYRVKLNGAKDTGFHRGIIRNDILPEYYRRRIKDLKIQKDGKILVGGSFSSYNNRSQRSLLRLNIDGSIDNSFSTGTGFGSGSVDISDINSFADGRIFITGSFRFYQGVWQGTMAVLNTDGSISNTFNADNGNGADANVNKIIAQPDNKILIAGYFSAYNGVKRNKIARLNVNGTLDKSFNAGPGPDSCNVVNTVALQKDGKILAGGNFARFSNYNSHFIVRLNPDGSIDNGFKFNAILKKYGDRTNGIKAIALQNNGKIIVALEKVDSYLYESTVSQVMRLNSDGSVDSSFKAFIPNDYAELNSIKIQKDGKILVAGGFNINVNGVLKNNLVRLNADGTLDETFNVGGSGPNNRLYSVNIQTNGKIIISGRFDYYNNMKASYLARLNANGNLDTSYMPFIPDNYIVLPISILDNNNKVILSYFYNYDDIYGRTLRYKTDGTIDNAFGKNNKTDYRVCDIALQDNKLLLGGFIESFNGTLRNRITRINTPETFVHTPLANSTNKTASKTAFVTKKSNISLEIYPNPVHDILQVKNLTQGVDKSVSIINGEGKTISVQRTSADSYSINTSTLLPGLYYLEIISDSSLYKHKFIKQ